MTLFNTNIMPLKFSRSHIFKSKKQVKLIVMTFHRNLHIQDSIISAWNQKLLMRYSTFFLLDSFKAGVYFILISCIWRAQKPQVSIATVLDRTTLEEITSVFSSWHYYKITLCVYFLSLLWEKVFHKCQVSSVLYSSTLKL
jgi:hypothetical protein